jgi:hypothetical protein
MLAIEPGVSSSASAGAARRSSRDVPTARYVFGRRMIERARRSHAPLSARRCVPVRRPNSDSSAGCSVSAAAIETSGIRSPATPIERMNGTGTKSSNPSPIATAAPEKTTARPAVEAVARTASSTGRPRASSSRKRCTTSRE